MSVHTCCYALLMLLWMARITISPVGHTSLPSYVLSEIEAGRGGWRKAGRRRDRKTFAGEFQTNGGQSGILYCCCTL